MNPQNYTINIRPGWGISQVVKVSQGDVGRPLAFTIMDGQDAITLSSTATVTITGTKPSGLGFTQDCTLSGNTASIDTVATMTQEAGSVPAELIVTDGSTVIGTANFVMYVEPAAHPEGTTDGDAETARDLMTRAQAAVEQAEAEADRAEEAAESASQTGISTVGATAGQVPTANGAGRWSWQDQQGGGGGSSSDDITNESTVTGATVTGALNSLSDQLANIEDNTQEIGTLTIKDSDGTPLGTYNGSANTQIVLPASGGGSTVTVTPTLTSGTEIGSITVDGTATKLYAPEGGSSGGGLLTWSEVLNIDFSTYEMPTNRHIVLSALPSYTKFVLTTFTPVSESTSDSRAMMSLNGVGYGSNTIFNIYKSGTTAYVTNTIIEYDGRYWWISQNSDRNTSSTNTDGSYKVWKRWGSPIVTGACTSLDFYFLAAPLSGQMVLYGGK